ncbi:hypothetical protein CsSME_00038489 [Camellia sinensis var. sinensis]
MTSSGTFGDFFLRSLNIYQRNLSLLSLSSLLLHLSLHHPLRHLPQHLLLRLLPLLYHRQPVESDEEEETFFDLEFVVPGSDEKEDKDDGTKPLSPISFPRSPPKFCVFMLFKKPKLEKIESADASPATHQQSKRFAEKSFRQGCGPEVYEAFKAQSSHEEPKEWQVCSGSEKLIQMIHYQKEIGQWIDGFNLFIEMRRAGVDIVDLFILSSIVGASANLAALELGKQIHRLVLSLGYESSLFVSNALVDMYAKCSDILAAKTIFDTMCRRDTVSWTSIIVGMAQHGRANESLSLHDERNSLVLLKFLRVDPEKFFGF